MHQDLTTWLQWFSNQEDLSSFSQPYFYPAWEHLPHEAKLPHADVISERLETLMALLRWQSDPENQAAPVIVTTIQALMQRTFEPDDLQGRVRTLKVGDIIDPLDLVEWLEDQAYEPEAKVTQKGEIALRGGILDVFPLSSPWPVRLEFFGDELESIRYFQPESQLTRDRVEKIELTPGGEFGIIKQQIEKNEKAGNSMLISFSNILDYLPRDACILDTEPLALQEAAEHYMEQIPEDDPYFMDWHGLLKRLNDGDFKRAELKEADEGGSFIEDSPEPMSMDQGMELHPDLESMELYRPLGDRRPEAHIAEKQRQDFLNQMHRWLRKGYQVLVICNNEGESQRFRGIWSESGFNSDSAQSKNLHLL